MGRLNKGAKVYLRVEEVKNKGDRKLDNISIKE
jgi:hypothetical protein